MTTTNYQPAWNAGKGYGQPPVVYSKDNGGLYEITHPTHGTFTGRVLAVVAHHAFVEIVHGIARAFDAEDERGPGERVTVRDCDYFFVPIRN